MQGERIPEGKSAAKEEVFVLHADTDPSNSEGLKSN